MADQTVTVKTETDEGPPASRDYDDVEEVVLGDDEYTLRCASENHVFPARRVHEILVPEGIEIRHDETRSEA